MAHGAGTLTNVATACAELIIDSGPLPKVCDEDDETVVFTPPPVSRRPWSRRPWSRHSPT